MPAKSELSQSFVVRYGYAALSVGLATEVRSLLDPVLGNQSPFPSMLLAALVTVWLGGIGPSMVAVILGALSADYFFIVPRGSFGLKSADQYVDLAFYLAVGTGIVII